ncbi:MAG: AIR synthase, partial [Cyanobacteria bacterium M_surface_7_m2_040]|nr:AIR synthase [Cyanobacteria bacterium M_surface_7_m2_040]
YAPEPQLPQLCGLSLDYRSDLSGGGFLAHPPEGLVSCACGAAFGPRAALGTTTQ